MIVEESVTLESWEESAIVPDEVFNQLGSWVSPNVKLSVIIVPSYGDLIKGVQAAKIAIDNLAIKMKEVAVTEGYLMDTIIDEQVIDEYFYYGELKPKRYWGGYSGVFVTTPIYVNPFTQPYMADMRLHIFRPKLRSNHPKN